MSARSTRPIPIVLLAVLLAAGMPVMANHTQNADGRTVAFDHVAGNEWWVEVRLSGPDAASVASVEAQDTNGPWTALSKKSWGPYAASFHIEPGHQVRFRATWSGGAQVVSCPFTHPAGVEEQAAGLCAGSSGSSTTSSTITTTHHGDPCEAFGTCPALDATFKGVRGNEWWVQATVTANKAIAKVEATLDGGATYKALPKQSWGGYAASFRVVQGSVVQLRATATDGATDLSACHQWIPAKDTDARVVPCPGSTTTTSTTSTTTTTTSTTTTSSSTSTSGTPPRAWQTRRLGDMPGVATQVFAADVDMDGRGNIPLIGTDGLFEMLPSGLVQYDMDAWWQGQVANADNDLWPQELYMVGYVAQDDANYVMRVTQQTNDYRGFRITPFYGTKDPIGPLHVMDLHADGLQELYVVHDVLAQDGSVNATIELVQVADTISEGPRKVVDLGDGGDGGFLTVMAIGSGNVSGVPTMFVFAVTMDGMDRVVNQVYAVQAGAEAGSPLAVTLVASFLGEPMFYDVVDLDLDGHADPVAGLMSEAGAEIVLLRGGAAYAPERAKPFPGMLMMLDLEAGDMDGDGVDEAYVTTDDGRIHRLRRVAANAYSAQAVASIPVNDDVFGPYQLAIGNGDGDAHHEMYALALMMSSLEDFTTRVFEVSFEPVAFDATFTGIKGNAWWVQANVAGTQPIAGVEARVDCGAWRPLVKQSWGGWAASFHVPSGAKVDFRATSTAGLTDVSGGYTWPTATPTAAC